MNKISKTLLVFLGIGILSVGLVAQTVSAGRYDGDIQSRVSQQLAAKKEFRNLQAATEDGMVTLTGTVDVYQQKLDAAKKVRKTGKVQGVRNLIVVSSNVPDAQLAAQLDRKLYFDRIGYDNRFNFVTVTVKDGVATVSGETRTDVGRDSALALVNNTPGVKDVVNDIKVSPVSIFDDDIRVRATRAIYNDPVLGRYATDPAAPIRIVVSNGKLSLYGTVENAMDKQMAGIRANQVVGVFSVANNLVVAKHS
ncbi:MAG: phospholipid-binding protein [Acidobacteria bacterium]|nr:MAG: phospholipid-binding protein [Acidobacteriota bacterium]